MRQGSVKRPIFVYSLVFMLASACAIVTLASIGILRSSRDAETQTLRASMRQLSRGTDLETISRTVEDLRKSYGVPVFLVRAGSDGEAPIGLNKARMTAMLKPNQGWAAESIPGSAEEAYLVFSLDSVGSLRSASAEIRRMILLGFGISVILALAMSLLISRLVLSPIGALERMAKEAAVLRDGLSAEDAPNEIIEVARAFMGTVRQMAEDREEIQRQHRELELMQASLVRASKLASVGRLAAGIAHEIGNPLAAVLGYLSLLKDESLSSNERSDILERTSTQLNRIHETIQKLLTYARQEQPDSEVAEPFSTSEVVHETLALLAQHPELRAVAVHNQLEVSGDDVLGHRGPLSQVLVNLILNAAYALRGRPDPEIVLDRLVLGDGVELRVRDNGPGIPPDLLEQIFDPFFTSKPPGEGTGLGLAVSRALMNRMGGELEVESEPGGGATFRIKLRRVDDEAPSPEVGPAEPA